MQLVIVLQVLIALLVSLMVWRLVFRRYRVPIYFVFVSHAVAFVLGALVFMVFQDLPIENRTGTTIGLTTIQCPLAAILIYSRRRKVDEQE